MQNKPQCTDYDAAEVAPCREKGTATDAAGAASILASLVSLRLIPQIAANKRLSSPLSLEDDDQNLVAHDDATNSMGKDADDQAAGAEEAAESVSSKPLLRHPGVEVDPEAHGPALRELSYLFSTGARLSHVHALQQTSPLSIGGVFGLERMALHITHQVQYSCQHLQRVHLPEAAAPASCLLAW